MIRIAIALSAAPLALLPSPALAHGDGRQASGWLEWTGHADVTLPLIAVLACYAVGMRRMLRRGARLPLSRAIAFAAGWAVLAATMVSPLHAIGATLFTAHMVEHELMVVVAAPLLAAARPMAPLLWSLPDRARRAVARVMASPPVARWRRSGPGTAAAVHALATWAWHVPVLYNAALENVAVHWLQHVSFFASALWLWSRVMSARNDGAAMLALFATMLHTGLLGALFFLANRPYYPLQSVGAEAWGLTPLEDQHLAGIVMWVPAGFAYIGGSLWLAYRWLTVGEPRRAAA